MKYAITSLLLAALLAGCAVNSGTAPVGGAISEVESPKAKTGSKASARPLKPAQRVDALLKSLDSSKKTFSNSIDQV